MVELDVEVIIKTRMASLTQRAIKKLERGGIRVVSVERSANRATVHGKLRVIARTPRAPHCDGHKAFQYDCLDCTDKVITKSIAR